MTRLSWPAAILAAMLSLAPAPGRADPLATCRDTDLDTDTRLAGCEAAAEAAPSPDDAARALGHAARLLRDADRMDAALEAADRAVALAQTESFARGVRANLYKLQDRLDLALADMDAAVLLEPDNNWNHYYRGTILVEMRRFADALAALDRSVALKPDYFFAQYERGRALKWLHRDAEAALAYAAAVDLRPLSRAAVSEAGSALWRLGEEAASAGYALMLTTLEPNDLLRRDQLDAFLAGKLDGPANPAPEAREPAALRYLRVYAPVDTRDEMEIAIGALVNFFGGNENPVPMGERVFDVSLTPDGGQVMRITRTTIDRAGRSHERYSPVALWRGLIDAAYQPIDDAPVIVADFGLSGDGPGPADIWPLAVGNRAEGTADYLAICTDDPTFAEILMGCRIGVDVVPRGTLDWSVEVTGAERVFVPLGFFDCWVIHYRQQAEITILGHTRRFDLDLRLWYAPELGTYVKRMQLLPGDEYVLDQALALLDDG